MKELQFSERQVSLMAEFIATLERNNIPYSTKTLIGGWVVIVGE